MVLLVQVITSSTSDRFSEISAASSVFHCGRSASK